MRYTHPRTELAPYLRGDLSAAERERVARHLEGCARCRADADAYAAVLKAIAFESAAISEPDWTDYRAEIHRKIAARRAPVSPERARWKLSPRLAWTSIAAAGAAVAAIVLLLMLGPRPEPGGAPPVEQLAMEDAIGAADVGLLRDYPVVEHLDLLENYDVIEHLDEFAPADTTNEKRS
ncbi:MAG TPA: zf-HC2 domain-containing protein [Candidatus Binataceae bacterium]|nr:zf-HC2 domain-containing protein [Candidatus Binataceae bacterium]